MSRTKIARLPLSTAEHLLFVIFFCMSRWWDMLECDCQVVVTLACARHAGCGLQRTPHGIVVVVAAESITVLLCHQAATCTSLQRLVCIRYQHCMSAGALCYVFCLCPLFADALQQFKGHVVVRSWKPEGAHGALCPMHTFHAVPYERPMSCGIGGTAVVWYQQFGLWGGVGFHFSPRFTPFHRLLGMMFTQCALVFG